MERTLSHMNLCIQGWKNSLFEESYPKKEMNLCSSDSFTSVYQAGCRPKKKNHNRKYSLSLDLDLFSVQE